jgi:ABC-type transport system involved in multi-copper enzyme maturation permease subunit
MTTNSVQLLIGGFVLALVQFLAAVPWVAAFTLDDPRDVVRWSFLRRFLPRALVGVVVAGVLGAAGLYYQPQYEFLGNAGRVYGAVLYLQLVLDLVVLVFGILLLVWPRGAAVALAAFREGIRQPLFWFVLVMAVVMMVIMPFVPYFTFGEDLKMVKELGYGVIMLCSAAFAVLSASISISEEIEGRTAITLMSKPVSRRQFLLGKFVGILMAAFLMMGVLSLGYLLMIWYKPIYDREDVVRPIVLMDQVNQLQAQIGAPSAFMLGGVVWWFYDALVASPGLILGFCQVMVLLAISVALATRLPMVVNLVVCLVVFFLGHLAPILAEISQKKFALVGFMAELFKTLLPGLDLFDIGPALTRDVLPPAREFALYVGSVSGYALLYTSIALLFGLLLFEDRDLA